METNKSIQLAREEVEILEKLLEQEKIYCKLLEDWYENDQKLMKQHQERNQIELGG